MSRSKAPQLQPFDVVEVPIPKPPKKKSEFSIWGSILHFVVNVLLLAISVAWLCLIFQYGLKPWLRGPLNAWHHTKEFKVFMSTGILWIFLLRQYLFKRLWALCSRRLRAMPIIDRYMVLFEILQWIIVLTIGITAVVMVCVDDPFVRSCTRDSSFRVHFKLTSVAKSVRGIVQISTEEGDRVWDMSHYPWAVNPNVYTLRLWRKRGNGEYIVSNVSWPVRRAVTEVVYDLSHVGDEGKGTMAGFCSTERVACLNGTVEMEPLRLEWTYTDPVTGEKAEKVLQSKGRWQFGTNHRPWVNLWDGKDENLVFSAPSSKWVCGGGDGDLRDAVVPVGLIMIAEQRYKKRY